MYSNKRKFARFDSVIDGTFHLNETNTSGQMIMTNFSRDGFKASLNMPIVPGKIIQFEMRFPGNLMPIFTQGKVVWLRNKNKDMTYGFDVGIKLLEIDSLQAQQIMENSFKNWQFKQIADYALYRGYYAKKFPEQYFKLTFLMPSLFLIYIILGAIVSLFNHQIALIYSLNLTIYALAIFLSTISQLISTNKVRLFLGKIRLIFPICLEKVAMHISYGFFFLIGIFSKNLPKNN
ncbi:MAG: PilZ domain-containing protein [Candidatus Omnitrophota bacterium]